jgi:hypothetical protein
MTNVFTNISSTGLWGLKIGGWVCSTQSSSYGRMGAEKWKRTQEKKYWLRYAFTIYLLQNSGNLLNIALL